MKEGPNKGFFKNLYHARRSAQKRNKITRSFEGKGNRTVRILGQEGDRIYRRCERKGMEFVLKFPFKRACDRLMACLKMCFPRQVFDLLDFSILDLLDFLVNRAEHLQAMRTTPASIPNSLKEHLLGSVIPYSGLTWARLHHSCKLVTRLGSPCDPIIYQRLHHS